MGKLEQIANWADRAERADWSARALAIQCGVSLSTLERYIKKQFGMCPKDWLRHIRIQRSIPSLARKLSVKLAAAEAGYESQSHFSREFKKSLGYPPSQHTA